jgi:hypothetical protein
MYKDMFKEEDFSSFEIIAAQELINKIWDTPKEVKLNAMKEFLNVVCPMYFIPVPEIHIIPNLLDMWDAHGMALIDKNRILLSNYSFVTFLHEFRHMAQQKLLIKRFLTDTDITLEYAMQAIYDAKEEDAIGYSVSLFYLLAPDKYEKAVEENRLAYK